MTVYFKNRVTTSFKTLYTNNILGFRLNDLKNLNVHNGFQDNRFLYIKPDVMYGKNLLNILPLFFFFLDLVVFQHQKDRQGKDDPHIVIFTVSMTDLSNLSLLFLFIIGLLILVRLYSIHLLDLTPGLSTFFRSELTSLRLDSTFSNNPHSVNSLPYHPSFYYKISYSYFSLIKLKLGGNRRKKSQSFRHKE